MDLRTGLEYIFFSVTYFHTLVANKLSIILNTRQSELTCKEMIMRITGILLCSHFRDGVESTVMIVYEKSSSPSLALPCEL